MCLGEWDLAEPDTQELTEEDPGPLSRPGLRLTGVFLGVLAVGLVLGWILSSDEGDTAAIGEAAPDFTVPLIGGGSFTLSDQLDADDRTVVLNLWASWCLPCREEIPEISAFSDSYPEVKVVGVAVEDTEQAATSFAEEMQATYDMGIGDRAFEDAYPRLGLPITYVIEADGTVIESFNGILDRETLETLVFD